MQGKLPKSLTFHLLCQPHTLYISIYSIFLPSYSEQWPPEKPAYSPNGLLGQSLTGVVPALCHFCQSKTHGGITAIHIMPTAAGAHGWTSALCHPSQMCVTGLSGSINLYSSINLAEFTNLRLWLHQMWIRMSHFCLATFRSNTSSRTQALLHFAALSQSKGRDRCSALPHSRDLFWQCWHSHQVAPVTLSCQ